MRAPSASACIQWHAACTLVRAWQPHACLWPGPLSTALSNSAKLHLLSHAYLPTSVCWDRRNPLCEVTVPAPLQWLHLYTSSCGYVRAMCSANVKPSATYIDGHGRLRCPVMPARSSRLNRPLRAPNSYPPAA
eukprot:366216-Chlamydomonas_euryale.AAC.3